MVWLSGSVLNYDALGLGVESPQVQCFFLLKVNKRFLNGTFINKHSLVVPVFKHSLVGHLLKHSVMELVQRHSLKGHISTLRNGTYVINTPYWTF